MPKPDQTFTEIQQDARLVPDNWPVDTHAGCTCAAESLPCGAFAGR
jgi:hypothetical protein